MFAYAVQDATFEQPKAQERLVAKKDVAKPSTDKTKQPTKKPPKSEPVAAAQVSEQELDRKHERWMRGAEIFGSLMMTSIICVGCCTFALVTFFLPVLVAHGEVTTIELTQKWLADMRISTALGWGGAAVASGAAVRYRRKMIKERQSKDGRIKDLEMRLDPDRTSSGLLPDGRSQ